MSRPAAVSQIALCMACGEFMSPQAVIGSGVTGRFTPVYVCAVPGCRREGIPQ